jgi:hypothetical protein
MIDNVIGSFSSGSSEAGWTAYLLLGVLSEIDLRGLIEPQMRVRFSALTN